MSLTTLPILPLEVFASYLEFILIFIIIILFASLAASTSYHYHYHHPYHYHFHYPLLPLKVIASYLDFSSLVSLSASTSSLAHLQPKQQIVKGENFSVAGFNPTYSPKRISQKGISRHIWKRNHHPEHYFDVVIETGGLLGIKMVWEWEGKVSKGERIKS